MLIKMDKEHLSQLRRKQSAKLLDMFRKHGYNTQNDIVMALQKNGYYPESKSLRAYLSQVFIGTRRPSAKLIEGLALVCENDSEIMGNFKQTKDIGVDEQIIFELDSTYDSLRERVQGLDRKGKLIAMVEVTDYLRGYLERLK